MNEQNSYQWKVCVKCMTYNQSNYITAAMNGFTMQQTTFPYVCCIVDDSSTDGEKEVIKQYLQDNFDLENKSVVRNEETDDYILTFAQHKVNKNCYFAVLYLKYNHYGKKSKLPYYEEWQNSAKYIAICEGDDYWIDEQKLQIQVDYMDIHPECTMTCNRSKLFSVKDGKYIGEQYCRKGDGLLNPIDVINRTGLYISTCSIVYRPFIKVNYPGYCVKCKVGDYPLQIMAAMKGNIYYFDDVMSVYRVNNPSSWMGQQKWGTASLDRIMVVKSQVAMFRGFSIDFPQYANVFMNKVAEHINCNIPHRHNPRKAIANFLCFFEEDISGYSLRWKIDLEIQKLRIPLIRRFYIRFFLREFHTYRKFYR